MAKFFGTKAPYKTRMQLTLFLLTLILAIGVGYQYYYNRQRTHYRKIITGYYLKYFNRQPDPIGLDHWVMWAQNKWGLEKVEEKGFVESKERSLLGKVQLSRD